MSIVTFGNNGKIDPCMWETFGVSVKETDTPIGQFGTGLKYAIAVLVREGREIRIESCGEKYVFSSETTVLRGKEFSRVTCNGQHLPFTTHLGSKWELWQAYRELYSNCVDEGGSFGEGETTIYAEIGDIEHSDVFLDTSNRRLVESSRYCEIFAGGSKYIYVNGIRASEVSGTSLFTYNLKAVDLTEDRTLKYDFQKHERISEAVFASINADLVYPFIFGSKGYFEEHISFNFCDRQPSELVTEYVKNHRKDKIYMQPALSAKALSIIGLSAIETRDMDSRQQAVLNKALAFCKKIGFEIKYPVMMSDSLGDSTLAMACRKTDTIYLSDVVMDQGTKQVVSALIEENLHIEKGLNDCTYKMQTFLFDKIVTMGEYLTGDVL